MQRIPFVQLHALPEELKSWRQWVGWQPRRVGPGDKARIAKLPLAPRTRRLADCMNPATWTGFGEAVEAYQQNKWAGIGFVFTADDPYVGIDFDDCRDPLTGKINDETCQRLARLGTYTEVSPSGTGVKCIARGTLPVRGTRHERIELYASARYFTLTGQVVENWSVIEDRPDEVLALYKELKTPDRPRTSQSVRHATRILVRPDPDVSDDIIFGKASAARNGEKFRQLWQGTLEPANGDHSRADLMLCRILAFWCNGNEQRIQSLFRQSKLYRTKWDEPHATDGRNYGEITIQRAVSEQVKQAAFYSWPTTTTATSIQGPAVQTHRPNRAGIPRRFLPTTANSPK